MTTILHAAFTYLDEGYAVIPVSRETKRPLVKWLAYQRKWPNKLDWMRWLEKWPACNLGLVTGFWQNRFVLDFDSLDSFERWKNDNPLLYLSTPIVETGRGYHAHFEATGGVGHGFVAHHPDGFTVEVKAKGNYVVIPPSVHASGWVYQYHHQILRPRTTTIERALGKFQRRRVVKPQVGTSQASPDRPGDPTPDEEMTKVEAIKQTFRIERYVKAAKTQPDSRGRIAAQCPLPGHDDRHMSFWYHPDEQVCACAVCTGQGTWDVINLYAAMHGLTNNQAIDELYQLTPQGLKRR
jgi:hypothetical protein